MTKAKPKSNKIKIWKSILLAVLPALFVVGGLLYANSNIYYDIDTQKTMVATIGGFNVSYTTSLATTTITGSTTLTGNLLASQTNTYNLGSAAAAWDNLYVNNLYATSTSVLGNQTITGTLTVTGTSTLATTTIAGDLTVNTSDLFVQKSTGRVGIGTVSPASELSVEGGISVGAGYTGTAAPTDGMIIKGNVGIGMASPGARLQINGATSDDTAAALYVKDFSNKFLFYIRNDGQIGVGDANQFTVSSAGAVNATSLTLGTALDISADTNLAAGRSLTMSDDTVNADAELYTSMASINVRNATITRNPASQIKFATAVTITRISCSSNNGITTIQFDERAEATPYTSGSDVMTAALECGTVTASTTSFANAGIAADAPLSLDLDAVTGNATTSVSIFIDYLKDD